LKWGRNENAVAQRPCRAAAPFLEVQHSRRAGKPAAQDHDVLFSSSLSLIRLLRDMTISLQCSDGYRPPAEPCGLPRPRSIRWRVPGSERPGSREV
jgi:hypothetical protein